MTPRAEHMGREVRERKTAQPLGVLIGRAHGTRDGMRGLVQLYAGGEKWFSVMQLDADPLPPTTEVAPHG